MQFAKNQKKKNDKNKENSSLGVKPNHRSRLDEIICVHFLFSKALRFYNALQLAVKSTANFDNSVRGLIPRKPSIPSALIAWFAELAVTIVV